MRCFAIAVNKTNNPAVMELTFYGRKGEKRKIYSMSFGEKFVRKKLSKDGARKCSECCTFYLELSGKTSLIFVQKPRRGNGMSSTDT